MKFCLDYRTRESTTYHSKALVFLRVVLYCLLSSLESCKMATNSPDGGSNKKGLSNARFSADQQVGNSYHSRNRIPSLKTAGNFPFFKSKWTTRHGVRCIPMALTKQKNYLEPPDPENNTDGKSNICRSNYESISNLFSLFPHTHISDKNSFLPIITNEYQLIDGKGCLF